MPTHLSICFQVIRFTEKLAFAGSASHGLLFALLKQADPQLANQLHSQEGVFSLDISDLERFQQQYSMSINNQFDLRIGFIDDAVAEQIKEALESLIGQIFDMGDKRLLLTLQAVRASLSLSQNAILTQSGIWSRCSAFTIEFHTPTVFRSKGHYHCLPQSSLLFGGFSRKVLTWLPADYADQSNELYSNVLPDQYQLKTAELPVQHIQHAAKGFIGECLFRNSLDHNSPARQSLGIMLALMPYLGVGCKTAMGLGAVEINK